jgi:hypothetical protein
VLFPGGAAGQEKKPGENDEREGEQMSLSQLLNFFIGKTKRFMMGKNHGASTLLAHEI